MVSFLPGIPNTTSHAPLPRDQYLIQKALVLQLTPTEDGKRRGNNDTKEGDRVAAWSAGPEWCAGNDDDEGDSTVHTVSFVIGLTRMLQLIYITMDVNVP